MERKTHLVGAWPGQFDGQAMQEALERVGAHLLRMTDGETGNRRMWVASTIDAFRGNPDVELVQDGRYTFDTDNPSADSPVYRVREGHTLDPDNIQLIYTNAFRQSYPQFRVLRERFGYPDISFQVGVQHPLDVTMSSFEPEAAREDTSLQEAVTEASIREIDTIMRIAGDDVIFQIETVRALVAVVMTPEEHQAGVAEMMAGQISGLAERAPEGARFGVHLCLGDFHHKAFATITDMRPMVLLANAVTRTWPDGRSLEFLHFPFAAADIPPSLDDSFHQPLGELRLDPQTRFAAGFVHESLELDAHHELLSMIERYAGRPVDPSAACGLGRRPDDAQAWDAMDKARQLIEKAG